MYQAARRLLNRHGDSGEELRSTWKAIVRMGLPEEEHWPYDRASLEREPDALLCGSAQKLPAVPLRPARSAGGSPGEVTLRRSSPSWRRDSPRSSASPSVRRLPRREKFPTPLFSMASAADRRPLRWATTTAAASVAPRGTGDREFAGANVGRTGLRLLPYTYVRERLATDFWTLVSPDWLLSGSSKPA